MSTENQNLDQASNIQTPNPGFVSTGKLGDVMAEVLKRRALQGDNNPLISISSASKQGKTDLASQVEALRERNERDEQKVAPSFSAFLKALAGATIEHDGEFRENESKGNIELNPKDFMNKKISINIEVSDLIEDKQLNSKLTVFLDAKGAVSFQGDSGLTDTTNSLERVNVIAFSTVIDAMKELYIEEIGGDN